MSVLIDRIWVHRQIKGWDENHSLVLFRQENYEVRR